LVWSTLRGCPSAQSYSCRPKLLVVRKCTQVVVSSVELVNSPLWTVTLVQSQQVLFDHVTILGDQRWPNNDGIDPVGSSDVLIQDSVIATGDDCVCCITHTADPIRNVTVRRCSLSSTSAALKVSVYDADASGDIEDILFEDNIVTNTNRALGIMPRWGSSNIRRVMFRNIVLQTRWFSSGWWGAGEAVYITPFGESAQQQWTGSLANVSFVNISGVCENGVVIYAPPTNSEFGPILFDALNLTIAHTSNYTQPYHDWRPAPPPAVQPAAANVIFAQIDGTLEVRNSVGRFAQPYQPWFGQCVNASSVALSLVDWTCSSPAE